MVLKEIKIYNYSSQRFCFIFVKILYNPTNIELKNYKNINIRW